MRYKMKIWVWLKENWKWIIFPIGIIGFILNLFFWQRPTPQNSDELDSATNNALNNLRKASDERGELIKVLGEKYTKKIHSMSVEQLVELKKIRKESPEVVANWIDRL